MLGANIAKSPKDYIACKLEIRDLVVETRRFSKEGTNEVK